MIYLLLTLLVTLCHGQVTRLPFENIGNEIGVKVALGSPPQDLNLFVDLQATEFFVLSTDCTNCRTGSTRHLFSKQKSSTYQQRDQPFQYKDFLHGPVFGLLAKDNLEIGKVKYINYNFGNGNSTSRFFNSPTRKFDGLLGFANAKSSESYNAGLTRILTGVDKQILTIFQRKPVKDVSQGVFTLGGYDNSNCNNQRTAFPLVDSGLSGWKFQVTKFLVGPESSTNLNVTVDPTATSSAFPTEQFYNIVYAFKAKNKDGRHYVNCDYANQKLSFVNGNQRLEVPASAIIEKEKDKCVLTIMNYRGKDKVIKLDKKFFNNFCISYDLDSKNVFVSERNNPGN